MTDVCIFHLNDAVYLWVLALFAISDCLLQPKPHLLWVTKNLETTLWKASPLAGGMAQGSSLCILGEQLQRRGWKPPPLPPSSTTAPGHTLRIRTLAAQPPTPPGLCPHYQHRHGCWVVRPGYSCTFWYPNSVSAFLAPSRLLSEVSCSGFQNTLPWHLPGIAP